ncbi:MAG TPA: 2Fe-2S iron-sulfur cluster-binding protein, partial [Geminicoccaceae bacterium]
MRVVITSCGAELELERGTILDAAIEAGLPYPHGCRAGNCGSCRSRLLDGRVAMDDYAAEALSDQEVEDGLILACRATPLSDVRVAWLGTKTDEAPGVRRVRGRTVSVDRLTAEVSRLRLKVQGAPLFFLPGQYVELGFSNLPPSPYSMASTPGEPLLEFHIRSHPEGIGSRYVKEGLRPADPVEVRGPFGSAFLRPGPRPIL